MMSLAALPPVLLVAVGGGMGASLRYLLGNWTITSFPPGLSPSFPFVTWAINLGGSFLLGLLLMLIGSNNEPLRLLLGLGLLGGFTTFSTFSIELVGMINRGELLLALAYAVSAVAGGVVAAYLGVQLGRA